jgi:hypothetical protein
MRGRVAFKKLGPGDPCPQPTSFGDRGCVSCARYGNTSIDTNPSLPSLALKVWRSTSYARWMVLDHEPLVDRTSRLVPGLDVAAERDIVVGALGDGLLEDRRIRRPPRISSSWTSRSNSPLSSSSLRK